MFGRYGSRIGGALPLGGRRACGGGRGRIRIKVGVRGPRRRGGAAVKKERGYVSEHKALHTWEERTHK